MLRKVLLKHAKIISKPCRRFGLFIYLDDFIHIVFNEKKKKINLSWMKNYDDDLRMFGVRTHRIHVYV